MMTARELIRKYLDFFKSHGHAIIPGASLVPENDSSVLFTTAGMHPLVPFLMGVEHPAGSRLTNVQKCLRTDDIGEVGDGFHHTFFLMLGNWSLGGYFREEAIKMSFEFLTSSDWLGLDPQKVYVSVFAGDEDAPRDEESIVIWRDEFAKVGIEAKIGARIFPFGKEENWWGPVGEKGPCGPDTEMFFDTGKEPCGPDCNPSCQCGKYVEIWNDVFMEFNQQPDGNYEPLKQKNVDTGMGVERVTAILQGFGEDDYRTELFAPIIKKIEELSGKKYGESVEVTRPMRIVADHIRAAVFCIADGVLPSNKDRGYIVRRLIRSAVRHGQSLGIAGAFTGELAQVVVDEYQSLFSELAEQGELIGGLSAEEEQFQRTLQRGLKEFAKLSQSKNSLSGEETFGLYQTYGFPIELTEDLAREKGINIDKEGFTTALSAHQEKSRAGMEKKFAGGLAEHSEITTKYHTATHLLHATLRQVLGEHIQQKGSNITPERLRFDFSHDEKLTDEQVSEVESIVNQVIAEDLSVTCEEMSLDEAKAQGALAFFAEKYGDQVKVYTVGDFSREVCGGPHAERTGKLGHFKIIKQESVGRGVRRIKAKLE